MGRIDRNGPSAFPAFSASLKVLLDRRVEALQDGLASIETPMPTAGQCATPPAITGWS
jgi:hypothetical protein